jgi:hypothetical protein
MILCKVSLANIEQLNRSIQRLMRPSHLRDGSCVTDLYCPMVTHPTTGEMALQLPESETVPVHLEADGSELLAVLSVFVDKGTLTQADADAIAGAVGSLRGQEVRIADFIPESWSQAVMTQAQAEADGWFPVEEII